MKEHLQATKNGNYDLNTNVLKIGLVSKPKELPVHDLGTEPIVKSQSNRIKPGQKRSLVDDPIDSIRFLKT